MPRFTLVLIIGLVACWSSTVLSAQTPTSETSPSPSPNPADVAKTQNLQDARLALQFGIDATVISVIQQATGSHDQRISEEVKKLISSPNPDIQVAVMDYFNALESWASLLPAVNQIVSQFQDQASKSLVRALRFLEQSKTLPETATGLAIIELAKNGAKEKQLAAIRTLGEMDIPQAKETLKDLFDRSGIVIDVRRGAVEALAKKKDPALLSFFRDLYEDSGEDKEIRRQALGGIGLLANAEGLKTIRKASASQDLFERRSAAYALDGYPVADVQDLYRQALRDPAWQNRRSILGQIAAKAYSQFSDALSYMAEKDPETTIRQEAMHALVALGSGFGQINDWLISDKTPIELRISALSESLRKTPDAVLASLTVILDQEWKVNNSRLLETVARELATAKTTAGSLYTRLLSHPNPTIQLYAIQGIQSNKLVLLKPELQKLLDTKPDSRVKAALVEALK